jgi:hypothetical protein
MYVHRGYLINLLLSSALFTVPNQNYLILNLWMLDTVGRVTCTGDQPCRKADTHAGLHRNRKSRRDIHSTSGIRTHDPSVWEGENISYLTPREATVTSLTTRVRLLAPQVAAMFSWGLRNTSVVLWNVGGKSFISIKSLNPIIPKLLERCPHLLSVASNSMQIFPKQISFISQYLRCYYSTWR